MASSPKLVVAGENGERSVWESCVWAKRPDGSPRQLRHRKKFKTAKEAQRWHNERLADADDGKLESPRDTKKRENSEREKNKRESIGACIDHWLREHGPTLSNSARSRYELAGRQIKALVGTRSVAGFTRENGHALFAALEQRGGQKNKPLRTRSVGHARSVIQQSFAEAVDLGIIAANPFVGMKLKLKGKKSAERKPPAADVLNRLLAATEAEYQHLAIPVLLAIACGMRMGEILALPWTNVDLDAGVLRVNCSLDGTNMTIKTPKTASGEREIEIDADVVAALRAHKVRQKEWALLCGARYDRKANLINCDGDGKLWKTGTFSKMYARFARSLGVAASFHDLRHAHGSQLIKAGVDAKTVSVRLGHRDPRFTMSRYIHSDSEQDRRAASVMGGVLRAAKEAAKAADEAAS